MVQFREIPKKILDTVGVFTKEQLSARERRLASPAVQASFERTKNLLKDDFKNAASSGLEAIYRFVLVAPTSSAWEGTKELGRVVAHNFSVKKAKQKKSYTNVPAVMVTEFLSQWGKGSISTIQCAGNLSKMLGRSIVLGGRYLIGK